MPGARRDAAEARGALSAQDLLCRKCGRRVRTGMQPEALAGIIPGLAAAAAQLPTLGVSRRKLQAFLRQACGIDISQGAVQNCLDRASEPCNHTATPSPGSPGGIPSATWTRRRAGSSDLSAGSCSGSVMACPTLCCFRIMAARCTEAFAGLVRGWLGILVSDSSAVYLKRAGIARQCCLAL